MTPWGVGYSSTSGATPPPMVKTSTTSGSVAYAEAEQPKKCPACKGKGRIICHDGARQKCARCHGAGTL